MRKHVCRLEGYKKGRARDKEAGEVSTPVFFQTFFLRLDKHNMDDVCSMSRQINDNNIELNSRKSMAQEVYACYEINDKTKDEMEKIVSNEVSTNSHSRNLHSGSSKCRLIPSILWCGLQLGKCC